MLTKQESFTVRASRGSVDCAAQHRDLLVDPLSFVADNFLRGSLTRLTGYLRWGPEERCRFVLTRLSAHQQSCTVTIDPRAGFHGLTNREHQVASQIALGLNNQDISSAISCSPRTIDRHVGNILSRLSLDNRAQIASLVALTGGWLLPLNHHSSLVDRSPALAALSVRATRSTSDEDDAAQVFQRFRIGSLIPSGADRFDDALAMSRGEDLARTKNLRGGPLESDRSIDIIRVQSPSESAREALFELIDSGIHALVLGNFSPSVAVQLLTCTKDLGIPLLHSMVDNRLRDFVGPTTQFGHIFQICSDETVYIRAFAAYIENHLRPRSATNRITLVLREDESPSMQDAFRQLIEGLGPEEVQVLEYDDSTVNWASLALEIQQFQPHAVYLGIYLESSLATVLDYLHRSEVESHYYCVWVPGIPGFVERYPEIAEGLIWTTLVGNSGNYFGTRFRRSFESEYGSDPGIGSAAVHFDMVTLLKRAWSEADHSTHADDLVASLQEVQYQGVTGSFHFENGRRKALCYPSTRTTPLSDNPA